MLMFSLPGAPEWLVIAIVGLLIFGKRLPDVARSLGRTVVEFKKGLRDMEQEIHSSSATPPRTIAPPTIEQTAAPPQLPDSGAEQRE